MGRGGDPTESRDPPVNRSGLSGVEEGEGAPTSEEAFEAFLRERYAKLVATVRLITRDHHAAEDIVQEAFARAYVHWPKLWPEGNPAGWIHRVATNLAISLRRRLGREVRAVARLGRRADLTEPAPEIHPELHRAVADLPTRQRTAVSLHYVLGLKVAEVAEAMDCAPGTVKSMLFRARENLRHELGDEGEA